MNAGLRASIAAEQTEAHQYLKERLHQDYLDLGQLPRAEIGLGEHIALTPQPDDPDNLFSLLASAPVKVQRQMPLQTPAQT